MLETEFLKLKYHNNVESNTDEVDAEEYFNNNYKKIDANAKKNYEDLTKLKEDLEQENNELSGNMPWNNTSGKSLHITDSAKYSKNKLEISGDMEQEKRSGKNFIPLSANRTLNGVTLSVDEKGIYTLNGTATNVCFFTIPLKNVLPIGTSKTMSLQVLDGTASGNGAFYLAFRVRNSDNVYSNVPNMAEIQYLISGKAYVTKTITNECASAEITVLSGVTLNNVKLTIQLEEGTTATEFEKYGATPSTEFPSMPTVCTGVQKIRQFGKNIFDGEMELGTISTTNGTNQSSPTAIRTKNYIDIEDLKTLRVIRNDGYTGTNNYVGIRFYDKNKQFVRYTSIRLGELYNIETATNIGKYIKFIITNTTDLTFKYGINQDGSEEYEAYNGTEDTLNLGTTELCAIKDTNGNVVAKDRHIFRNNKWQWEKKIKKRVLNGTEDWQSNSNWNKEDTEIYHAYINLTDWKIGQKDVALDKFKFYGYTSWGDCKGKECCACNVINRSLYIFISTDKLETKDVAGLKKWLQNNNITMYYILATPEYIDCTAEQSAVLDKLYNNFTLQKGTNNIIVESSNGVGVNLELDYMQDNILKDKKLEDRVTALEDLLSTTQTSALLLDNLQNDLESEVN